MKFHCTEKLKKKGVMGLLVCLLTTGCSGMSSTDSQVSLDADEEKTMTSAQITLAVQESGKLGNAGLAQQLTEDIAQSSDSSLKAQVSYTRADFEDFAQQITIHAVKNMRIANEKPFSDPDVLATINGYEITKLDVVKFVFGKIFPPAQILTTIHSLLEINQEAKSREFMRVHMKVGISHDWTHEFPIQTNVTGEQGKMKDTGFLHKKDKAKFAYLDGSEIFSNIKPDDGDTLLLTTHLPGREFTVPVPVGRQTMAKLKTATFARWGYPDISFVYDASVDFFVGDNPKYNISFENWGYKFFFSSSYYPLKSEQHYLNDNGDYAHMKTYPNYFDGRFKAQKIQMNKEGFLVQLKNRRGQCLDVASGQTHNGNRILVFPCHDKGHRDYRNQLFEMRYDRTVRVDLNKNKCLDYDRNGKYVQVYDCHGGENQSWILNW